jgi:hypothetical protein
VPNVVMQIGRDRGQGNRALTADLLVMCSSAVPGRPSNSGGAELRAENHIRRRPADHGCA